MTFGHYTGPDATFRLAMDEAARIVTDYARRVSSQLAAGWWAHSMGGTPWPVEPVRGPPPDRWNPDRNRVSRDRKRRAHARRLHKKLRQMGRDRAGRRT